MYRIVNRVRRRLPGAVPQLRLLLPAALCAVLACADASKSASDGRAIASVQAALVDVQFVSQPFTYLGTSDGASCGAASYSAIGYRPVASGNYPLFLYFVGTGDPNDQPAARLITEAMARRGYVALSVGYDNQGWTNLSVEKILAKSACLFAPNFSESLVRRACGPGQNTDCSQGIVTWGHSQGAVIAALAASYDARVRGTWATGFGQVLNSRAWAITLMLEPERLRLVNGEDDDGANDPPVLNEITRRSCPANNGDVSINCFGGDNDAGWYIIDNDELADNPADHCWFYKTGCTGTSHIEPNWQNGSAPFSLAASAQWLDATRQLGEIEATRELTFNFMGLEGTTLTGQYPAGTVDWGTSSPPPGMVSFSVALGTPSHAFLGPFWSEAAATGQFTLWGQQGRTLLSVTAKNTASSSCTLSAQITQTDGNLVEPAISTIAAGATETIYFGTPNAKLVKFTSSKGARLQFHEIVVSGKAEQAVAP